MSSTSAELNNLREFFSESSQMYLFFSQVIFKELSAEAIESLRTADYPEATGNESLDQGYTLIRRYFQFMGGDPRTELACEYARIFLASGRNTKSRDVATPYESVFTSEEQLVMQESRDEVYRFYLEDGFKVEPSLHEPEDHLAFELEYLASMCERAVALVEAGELDQLCHNIIRQRAFINQHLLNWVPKLRKAAEEYAQLTFYVGMLLVIEGYAQESHEVLDEALEVIEAAEVQIDSAEATSAVA